MQREFEIVPKPHFRHLNVFLVRLLSRTPHIHGELELGLILDGQVTLLGGTGSRLLQKDDIFLINSLDAHEFAAEGNGALILSIQLSTRAMESFLAEPLDIRFLGSACLRDHFADKPGHYDYLRMLCVELGYQYLGCKPGYEYRCFSLTAQLLACLQGNIPHHAHSRLDGVASRQKNDRILSVSRYVEENFSKKLLLEDIARQEGVSMYYLSHLFKETLGISFQEYLKKLRFEHACNLLGSTQRSVLDISISSGFSDVRYLNRLFQEQFGCTPKQFRAIKKNTQVTTASSLTNSQYMFTQQDGFLLISPIRDRMLSQKQELILDIAWPWLKTEHNS